MACVSSSNNSSMATTSSKIMAAARTPFGSPPPKSKLPPFWNSNAHAEKTQITACLKESQQGDVENQQALPVMATSVPSLSFSKTAASMKSPITSCFERMLGAAQVIAQQESVIVPNTNVENIQPGQIGDLSTTTNRSSKLKSSSLSTVTTHSKHDGKGSYQQTSDRVSGASETSVHCDIHSPQRESERPSSSNDPFQRITANKSLYRQVVLAMALQKNAGKEKDSDDDEDGGDRGADGMGNASTEPPSLTINDGFFWKDYPPCEQILYEAMPTYYELSTQARQSKHQQKFNNDLVRTVRATATEHGYTFAPAFTDKKLRDRIRCFFKTHLQNAKKRLCTMQKRNHLAEHQAALKAMLEVIESFDARVPSLEPSNDDFEERPRKFSRSNR